MRKYLGIALALLVGFLFIDLLVSNAQEPVDWTDSLQTGSKQPRGLSVLRDRLEDLFDHKVRTVSKPVGDALEGVYESNFPGFENGNSILYVIIDRDLYLNTSEINQLIFFAQNGNDVFLITEDLSRTMVEEFGLEIDGEIDWLEVYRDSEELDSVHFYFDPYLFATGFTKTSQEPFNWAIFNQDGEAILTRRNYYLGSGETDAQGFTRRGNIFFCSTPEIFTNAQMLYTPNSETVSEFLSFVPPDREVWLDDYYHPEEYEPRRSSGNSWLSDELSFILSQPSLRSGLWLLVALILLFVLFEGKRTQRVIPVIAPLPNSTVEFTRTIGRLYYRRRDHQAMARKRVRVLNDYLRNHYYVNPQDRTPEFFQTMEGRSGLTALTLRNLFADVDRVQRGTYLTEDELIEFNEKIENFYTKGAR